MADEDYGDDHDHFGSSMHEDEIIDDVDARDGDEVNSYHLSVFFFHSRLCTALG